VKLEETISCYSYEAKGSNSA